MGRVPVQMNDFDNEMVKVLIQIGNLFNEMGKVPIRMGGVVWEMNKALVQINCFVKGITRSRFEWAVLLRNEQGHGSNGLFCQGSE